MVYENEGDICMNKLGFGLMRLPLLDANDTKSVDIACVCDLVDRFLEKGFTYFDTAYSYHQSTSEIVLRKALVERHPRQSFTVADKMPTWLNVPAPKLEEVCNEQLAKCGVDYFDYYLAHNITEKSYAAFSKNDGFTVVQKAKKDGKAKRIGFSFHDKAGLLDRILTEHPYMDFVQLQINYADWDSETVESRKCYEVATAHNKPITVMEPVKGGSLANLPADIEQLLLQQTPGKSPASWALRFVAALENVSMILSGMNTMEQVEENTETMRQITPLTEAEQAVLQAAVQCLNKRIVIPCTACAYCVEGCPARIPIPDYFSLYNNQNQFRLLPGQLALYDLMARRVGGKAADCVACGQCEEHCPQHIHIIDWMKEVSKVFDR